jgi:hypothetical protein
MAILYLFADRVLRRKETFSQCFVDNNDIFAIDSIVDRSGTDPSFSVACGYLASLESMTGGRTYRARVPSAALAVSFHVSQARGGDLPFISSTRLVNFAALALACFFRRPLRLAFASKR